LRETLLLVLAACSSASFHLAADQRFLVLSISISAALLFVLCRIRHRISSLGFRVAADAALLTPILFAPWLWMHR
jgi:hypothetical protein